MKNKNAGILLIAISIIIGIIILTFNLSMRSIVAETCTHGPTCTMYGTITTQTIISLIVTLFVFFIGIFLVFSKPDQKILIKKIKIRKRKRSLEGLDDDEKKVVELLQNENNAMFQSALMEKLEIGKVKATRLLDKLESKQLIERKRRGMNNIIVLKD